MTETDLPPESRPHRALRSLGVDRAVAYTVAGTAWGMAARFVTLLLTVEYLSPDQQGYALTYGSLLALQVFFELGAGVVVQQCASHEAGLLVWAADGTLDGDPVGKARLASLFRQTVGWYAGIAVLVAAVVGPAGAVFFDRNGTARAAEWLPGWVLTVAAAALAQLAAPLALTLNGAGRMADTARVSALAQLGVSLTGWVLLVAGAGLLALPAGALVGVVATTVGLGWRFRPAVLDLWRHPSGDHRVRWAADVWPFQWRVALSWLSGYFVFQLFNPVAFAFHSPAAAGRVGLSLTLVGQVQGVANIWLNTKMPLFGRLIARRQFAELDVAFRRAFVPALGLAVVGGLAVVAAAAALEWVGSRYTARLLPPVLLAVAAGNMVVQVGVGGMASYLRAFKREPFLLISLVMAALTGGAVYLLGRYVGLGAMLGGFLAVNVLVCLPWAVAIFTACRRRYQAEPGAVA